MLDPDSLVATRSRRSNAGSNLRKLIEIEEQATGGNQIVYTGDDENVELLFQEDENDGEFEESGTEEGSNEEEQSDEELGEETEEPQTKGESNESDQNVNSDEMLSDSDISASDQDESEGERDLQKREREKKRKKKPQSIIPAIKKPKISKPPLKPSVSHTKHSELLLTHDRRASSRKSALKNKETLVKKLKEDETRRAALVPVVRVKERKLTQQERLAQAVETERENVKSLHSFLEQEIVKKERQKLLFQQRRLKLRDVVRLSSKLSLVTPLDEIEDARYVHNMLEKKKKGRRRRAAGEVTEEILVPGAIDTSLPYYQKEMQLKNQEELKMKQEQESKEEERENEHKKSEEEIVNDDVESSKERTPTALDVTDSPEETSKIKTNESENRISDSPNPEVEAENSERSMNEELLENDGSVPSRGLDEQNEALEAPTGGEISPKSGVEKDESKGDNSDDYQETKMVDEDPANPEEVHGDVNKAPESTKVEDVQSSNETKSEHTAREESHSNATEVSVKTEEAEEIDAEKSGDNLRREDADGSIYEGPPQLVTRNFVSLMEFEGERLLPLASTKVKVILFGEGANSGASRRLRDVKTILKSSLRSDNPYSVPKEEKEDELMKPVTEIDEEDSIFEALRRIPRLGTKEVFEDIEEDDQREEATAVEIRTEAPTGLYLPNENKKLCLINGKEVRYFDPATGIPYDNKDGYKIIKSIENGDVPWLCLGKDQNAYGEVELYINNREGARHARGVPEGFDGF